MQQHPLKIIYGLASVLLLVLVLLSYQVHKVQAQSRNADFAVYRNFFQKEADKLSKYVFSIDPLSDRISTTFHQRLWFQQGQVRPLNFPTGTWQELMTNGYLKQSQKVDSRPFYLFSVPFFDQNLFLVHFLDADWFNNFFQPASEASKRLLFILVLLSFFLLTIFLITLAKYLKLLSHLRVLEEEVHQGQLSEKQYKRVLDLTEEGFWVVDLETNTVVDVNNGFCKMAGRPAGEIIGRPFVDFFSNCQEIKEGHAVNLETTKNRHLEAGLKRHDDTIVPVVINSTILFDEQQQKPFCFVFFTDISEMTEREEQLTLFFKAVNQSGSSIVITDKQGCIQYVNPQVSRVTGYWNKEIIGQDFRILKSGEQSEGVYSKLWQTICEGETWRGRLHNLRKDGTLFWEDVTISPIIDSDGVITHFMAIKDDVTTQVALEQKVKKTEQEALAVNEIKNEFLVNVSHEMRTPLSAILGMTELLLETTLNDQQHRFLTTVQQSATFLLCLTNDFLDLAKIESGKLSLIIRTFDLKKLIRDISTTLSPIAEKKGLELTTRVQGKGSFFFQGDNQRLQQVLLNLAGNAIKFTQQGGVDISVTLHPEADERVQALFRVTDTGIGIAREQQQIIFDRFSQGDVSVTREFGGTGLGLTICRQLVELMDGELWLESTPGKGSVFYFTVVLAKGIEELAETKSSHAAKEMAPSNMRSRSLDILLAEDNRGNWELIMVVLKNEGHLVTIVENGLEALHALSTHRFDLVFMDVQMPIMDGLTAIRCIRKYEEGQGTGLPELQSIEKQLAATLTGRHTLIIAATANAMTGYRELCFAAGADNYLVKPFDQKQLLELVANYGGRQSRMPPRPSRKEKVVAKEGNEFLEQVNRHLQDAFGVNADESKSIMETYGRTLEKNLADLKAAIEVKDLSASGCHAHSIKGALLNLGQNELAETAQRLEKAARAEEEFDYFISAQELEKRLKPLIDKQAW